MDGGQQHTTTKNVHIIDDAFYMPQLKRSRRIWLYLPNEYFTSKKHYPVIYMHDGQNLFDDATAFGEEWQVDEAMDSLKGRCIIVGIDNGAERRLNEYNVYDNHEHGKGEGKQYIQFIIQTLKPYIDKTYRTLPEREHTYTAGSSMGGLISFFAALYHPDVFGGACVFSPSFWLVPGIVKEVKDKAMKNKFLQRYFFYAGEKESERMVSDLESVTSILKQHKQYKIHTIINPDGEHSEATWRGQLPVFYKWLRKRSIASV